MSEGAEHLCRVCGYWSEDPPWGDDGRSPTYFFCPCCDVEWGYQDLLPSAAERFRARWLAEGAPWRDRKVPPDGLTTDERLRRIGAGRLPRGVETRTPAAEASDGRSAVTLTGSLRSIESWLLRLGRTEALRALRPGVSPAVVRQSLAAAGMVSSPSLEALYGWHDGTEVPPSGLVDDLEILPGYYFLGVEDAVAHRSLHLEHGAWESGWLPILTDGGGWCYLVDLGSGIDPVVRRWVPEDPGGLVAFDSLSTLLTTIEQAYVRGVVFVDHRGHLEMDDTQLADLAVELDPAASAAWGRDEGSPG